MTEHQIRATFGSALLHIGSRDPDPALQARRRQIRAEAERTGSEATGAVRAFGVLAILAPVITDEDNDVAYPGDPMALYSALSYPMVRATASFTDPFGPTDVYNDLCPLWPGLPGKKERPDVSRRLETEVRTTDDTVFDPRTWTPRTRADLVGLLRRRTPSVVLISAVSPAHRYALEIAALVKEECPTALVVLGGRHADETVRRVEPAQVHLAPSATGTACPVDVLVSGDGGPLLDLTLRAVARAMDLTTRVAVAGTVAAELERMAGEGGQEFGRGSILVRDGAGWTAFAVDGPPVPAERNPSPYAPFLIRSRFPIFTRDDGTVARCAHVLVSGTCPMRCTFCSESALLGQVRRPVPGDTAMTVERLREYVEYDAEAAFFDDSIFWSGSWPRIRQFCAELAEARQIDRGLADLQWGAQLTVDVLTGPRPEIVHAGLTAMRQAGCNYVYVGIESMSEQVMRHVHKNVRRTTPWKERVRRALGLLRENGIRVGSSVLFGLDGENEDTIGETIEEVGRLIDDGYLMLASPNILTYHPGTEITRRHGMEDQLDYGSQGVEVPPPYSFFEEAYPGVVSRLLTEDHIWRIHRESRVRWGQVRNGVEAVAM
ncbi:radical SAM protein [Streptomyces sp. TLI_185]|uniref:B12-binding domain-containing radical SAM protein n=1 Tax=Streptomyces sp. TLI_185 TaxID=2485151 RepID=UPI000FA937A0|nr:radical SAM protein [Streptomyces sp. TLI_185]RPF35115.1 radical SAM family protein [Streptomyces sp. TLI_185]